jgi:chromosome partitioning protein
VAKKIAIAVRKGGVGKTTTAKNLAAALAQKGHRVLLVDLDEQANATRGLNADPATLEKSLNDLFADPDLDPASVILTTELETLHLMPGHPGLAKTETGMAYQRAVDPSSDPTTLFRDILKPLEDSYDFMVFDTPPSIGYLTINALAAADELLIPAAASAYSEEGVRQTLQEYERATQTYNPGLRLRGILVTRVKRTNASSAVVDGITETYKDLLLQSVIFESTAVDEAEQLARPVVLYEPENAAALGYQNVADLLARTDL